MNQIQPYIYAKKNGKYRNETKGICNVFRAFLRSMKIEDLILFLGINLVFGATLLGRSNMIRGEASGTETFRYIAPGFLLILYAGGLSFLKNWHLIKKTIWCPWFTIFLFVGIGMLLRSIYLGYPTVSILWETVPYALVFTAFIGANDRTWSWIPAMVTLHAGIGCIITIIQLFFFDTLVMGITKQTTRAMYYGSDLSLATQLLYGASFVVFYWGKGSKWTQRVAAGCLIVYLLAAIFGSTRAYIKTIVILFTIAGFIGLRQQDQKKQFKKTVHFAIIVLGLTCSLLYAGLNTEWGHFSGFQMGFSNLMDRFVGEEYSVIQKTKNDFRWIEASIVIEDFKPMDWILGRGSAGSWSNYSAFGGMERSMTHVGYLHLILKGGVPLLLLFFVGPLGLGLFRLMTARKWETLACAGVLVAYSIDLITGGAPEQSLKIALVFLCFGRCIADKGHLSESQFVKPN